MQGHPRSIAEERIMQYRQMGNTGVAVSEIAFGTGGNAGLMIKGTFEEQVRAAARAIELGINYFDESPDYGDGVSETNLGKVLKELGVRPLINTKVEVRNDNLDDIASHVERSVEQSLERLGVDWVDIVQIHNGPVAQRPELKGRQYNILWIEDYLRARGALEGLERIRRAGKTRFVGFICRGNDGAQVRQLIDTGQFQMINLVYNLVNPSAGRGPIPGYRPDSDFGDVIGYAREHGVGVAVYNPLGGGVLTDTILNDREPHQLAHVARRDTPWYQGNVKRARALSFLSRPGRTMAQAAKRFILDNPGVTTVLGGFSGLEHIEEAVPASGAPSLTAEEMARIEMVWRGNFGGVMTSTSRGA
jgi:aryl-alcohol dehydrogenase-like predicted oxidoreductase